MCQKIELIGAKTKSGVFCEVIKSHLNGHWKQGHIPINGGNRMFWVKTNKDFKKYNIKPVYRITH